MGSRILPLNLANDLGERQHSTLLTFTLDLRARDLRYLELRDINVVLFPNAAMDLLRTVLECSLKEYLAEVEDPIPTLPGKPVMLSHALDHAHKHFKSSKSLATIVASLKNAKPQNEVQFSKSSVALNAVNHNPDVFFGPNEVRETWDHVRPLLKLLIAGKSPLKASDS